MQRRRHHHGDDDDYGDVAYPDPDYHSPRLDHNSVELAYMDDESDARGYSSRPSNYGTYGTRSRPYYAESDGHGYSRDRDYSNMPHDSSYGDSTYNGWGPVDKEVVSETSRSHDSRSDAGSSASSLWRSHTRTSTGSFIRTDGHHEGSRHMRDKYDSGLEIDSPKLSEVTASPTASTRGRRRNVFYSTFSTDSPRANTVTKTTSLASGSPRAYSEALSEYDRETNEDDDVDLLKKWSSRASVADGSERRYRTKGGKGKKKGEKEVLANKLHTLVDAVLGGKKKVEDDEDDYDPENPLEMWPQSYKECVKTSWNIIGTLIFLYYVGASVFYFIIRATRTLDMGYPWFGWAVLSIEIFTGTSTLAYAVLLCKSTYSRRTPGLPPARRRKDGSYPDVPDEQLKFHLRILVPCYRETKDLVERTVLAALNADIPDLTRRTVYLCDDGRDPEKEKMVEEMGPGVVYVTGRVRQKGEINGKSNNLNNCLCNHIYQDFLDRPQDIPWGEVIVVFDADMVCKPEFFCKVLEPMVDDTIALLLTPQGFHNVNLESDLFNNSNLSFWEYILPGCDAVGYIACTGTNFALRSNPLADCGWFPTYTITEDYALGMEMKKRGYRALYMNEYIAIGEAPEEVRNFFRQRSRWCKGQMQVLFSKACPLFDTGLPFSMRLLYTSVTWCYITNIFAIPLGVLIPFIAIVLGYYPLALNRSFALAGTLFYVANNAVTMYCTNVRHIKPLWFCTVSCHLLWFTFTKATFNVLISKTGLKVTTFKATKKKGQDEVTKKKFFLTPKNMGDLEGTKDAYVLFFSFFISFLTFVAGIYQIYDEPRTAQGDFRWYLLLSIFWAIYNMIPPGAFIFYIYNSGRVFEEFCTFCLAASFAVAGGALACIWLVPDDYEFSIVINLALQFFEANRSGVLPTKLNKQIWWRGDSFLDDNFTKGPTVFPLDGGYFDAGDAMKYAYSTSMMVYMLSWAYLEFRGGFKVSGQGNYAATTIRLGADWLQKCIISGHNNQTTDFVYQVGDVALDHAVWDRPEVRRETRPVFAVNNERSGPDVVAAASAALAASSVALSKDNQGYASRLLDDARRLYTFARSMPPGLFSRWAPAASAYNSSSFLDDLAFAACWLSKAAVTTQAKDTYLRDCYDFYNRHLTYEANNPMREAVHGKGGFNPFQWDYENNIWGVRMLLSELMPRNGTFKSELSKFVSMWRNGGRGVLYTKKGLAWSRPYGGLGYTMNAAFLTLWYAKKHASRNMDIKCWARGQVGYVLGDGGQAYVVGYGDSHPNNVPHRAASCAGNPPWQGPWIVEDDSWKTRDNYIPCTRENAQFSTDPNPHTLYGALVGGPNREDVFLDTREENVASNRVTLMNNAGFTATLAGLKYFGVNMAKCQQGLGMVSTIYSKITRDGAKKWRLGSSS